MTLTVERELSLSGGQRRRLPLLAGAAPVAGALLSWDASGYVHGLVAGEAFAGVCRVSVRKAFATDGEGQVDAVTGQFDLRSLAAIATIDATDVASATPIYASDDATLTATAASNTHVGAVAAIDSDGRVQISAATAEIAAAVATASDGGLFGSKTLVVSKAGNNAAGAASKYAAEFLTVQAAITAAVAGDTVVIRPGVYAESLTLKNGVNLFGIPGVTLSPDASGGTLFNDGGSGCTCMIDGGIDFESAVGGDAFANFSGSGVITIRGRKWVFNNAAATGIAKLGSCVVTMDIAGEITGRQNIVSATGTGSVTIRGDTVRTTTGPIVEITGSSPSVDVESRQPVSTYQILVHNGSATARVRIKAPKITATADDGAISVGHAGASRYDIDVDDLVACASFYGAAMEVHLRTRTHTSQRNGSAPLTIGNGAHVHVWTGQTIGKTGSNQPAVILDYAATAAPTAYLHCGRFVGDGTGEAAVFYGDGTIHSEACTFIKGAGATNSIAPASAGTQKLITGFGSMANAAIEGSIDDDPGSLSVSGSVV